ncbi:MAG: ABC transporter substrate-binding protein [Desulfobacter sp.]|nr:MAG: ABC transporter substrate-binding protein [Desulfobacter sp.]
MKRKFFFFAALFCSAWMLPGAISVAGEADVNAAQARVELEARVNEVLALIQDEALIKDPVKQEQMLYDKGLDIFDFNTFSMLALGRKYREFSSDQRQEFITWFSKLISNTYFPKLAGKDVSDIQVLYQDVHGLKPKKGIFRTDITTELVQGETRVSIVYRMIQKKEQKWKIYDIKIEGVSMAANYREQFKQDLSLTPEKIIAHLKEKVDK